MKKLTPLSQEIISRQATINIGEISFYCFVLLCMQTDVTWNELPIYLSLGTIGHVAHGKSTVVKAISGVHTVRFKNELERNITIKLGYANAKVIALFTNLAKKIIASYTLSQKLTIAIIWFNLSLQQQITASLFRIFFPLSAAVTSYLFWINVFIFLGLSNVCVFCLKMICFVLNPYLGV